MNVAIIEHELFGGTCVNNGCIPTKTLVASARVAYMAGRAAEFGIVIDGSVRTDMEKVKARKDAVVAKSNKGVENWLKDTKNPSVFDGHARFVGPHTVGVNGQVMEAHKIFINVGARATIPSGSPSIYHSLVSVAKVLVIAGVTLRALGKAAFFSTSESVKRKNHEFCDRN